MGVILLKPEELATNTDDISKKVELKDTKGWRKLLKIRKDFQSRDSWTPDMKFNECKGSIYRFYPTKQIINYGRF